MYKSWVILLILALTLIDCGYAIYDHQRDEQTLNMVNRRLNKLEASRLHLW